MNVSSNQTIGRAVWVDGREYLFFSGTSYLGLSSNPLFHDTLFSGIQRYGSNHPMSRISNVKLDIYNKFEAQFAKDFLAEDCMTLSSGFLAGRFLIEYYTSSEAVLHISPEAHPAIWKGLLREDTYLPHHIWVEKILLKMNEKESSHHVIFCNSLNSLDGQIYSFDWIDTISPNAICTIVIDDSHGIGVIGKQGKGIIETVKRYEKKENINIVITASLGKSLGLTGGIILGKSDMINAFKQSTYYTAGSPIIPAYLYAYLNSKNLREKLFIKLRENLVYLIKNTDFFTQKQQNDFPVYQLNNPEVYALAYNNNIILSSFPYPFKDSPHITRTVITACHEPSDLERLCTFLNSFMQYHTHSTKETTNKLTSTQLLI